MSKKMSSISRTHALAEFTAKLAAKWRSRTLPSTPAAGEHASTERILRDLVAMPTVTGNYEANHQALDYIDSFLSSHGMYVQRHEWNGVESLVATTRRTKTPTVMLTGHVDVVAAPSRLFQLESTDNTYRGRGVLDMKGALAAYLGTVRELQPALHEYDFGIMVVTDEEIGGFDGAANLAEEGYLPKVMVLPDGGLNNWDMERFAKGIWWITLEATGKVAHGSRPWEGLNPIDMIMAACNDIRALFPDKNPAEMSTCSLDVIHAGKTINQIPAKATASLDMRLASFEDQADLYRQVISIAERHKLKLTTEVEADPMINDVDDPYLQAYKACTEKVIGRKINWVVSNAGNDGRFFAKRGVPCAIAYPEGGRHHSDDEYITRESLQHMQDLFTMYLQQVARHDT